VPLGLHDRYRAVRKNALDARGLGAVANPILFTPGNESCEAWFRIAGDPAPAHELPEPGPPDVARLKAAAEQLDNPEILGPPPFD
jgi:hypothetical protein